MKRIVAVLAMLVASAATAAPVEPMECANVAGKMAHNPFSLSIGEYDTLSVCAYQFRKLKTDEAQAEKEDKAIERNFMPAQHKKMEDGE